MKAPLFFLSFLPLLSACSPPEKPWQPTEADVKAVVHAYLSKLDSSFPDLHVAETKGKLHDSLAFIEFYRAPVLDTIERPDSSLALHYIRWLSRNYPGPLMQLQFFDPADSLFLLKQALSSKGFKIEYRYRNLLFKKSIKGEMVCFPEYFPTPTLEMPLFDRQGQHAVLIVNDVNERNAILFKREGEEWKEIRNWQRLNEKLNGKKVSLDSFSLWYSFAGMGSNFGSMQPVFKIEGSSFSYTNEKNTHFQGETLPPPEKLLTGRIRQSSIDSIIDLVKDINDTLVYRCNPEVRSGGFYFLSVRYPQKTIPKGDFHIFFDLHNASHPTAQKIVDILNTYIGNKERKLWLWSD